MASLHHEPLHKPPQPAKPSMMFRVWTGIYFICGIVALIVAGTFMSAEGEGHRAYIVTSRALRFYIFLGLYFIFSSLLGIFASLAPLKRKKLLYYYMFSIAVAIFITFIFNVWLWTGTLNINDRYRDLWINEWSDEIKLMFEDQDGCCGFLSRDDNPVSSSASCLNKAIKHGCLYAIIMYTQRAHRYVYAGLISFSLVGLCCIVMTLLLISDCDSEHRMRLSLSHYWRKRSASKATDTGDASPTSLLNANSLNY
ncbi:hypothetical protein BX667DRAFT_341438 [Coemansia mojavensis]|nr:hypothetical protein BX667DRAFT_341438 [Coemansia mojavensis]